MLFLKGYSMNSFLVNFKTPKTTLAVSFKFENHTFSFKLDSGRSVWVFIGSSLGRFGAKR